MKDKGKAVDLPSSSSSNWFTDYCSSSETPCKKHPSSSAVGICALCLKDRLIKLVCSDCGEQRLSSCSCSDISSSYPNSCSVDIGSVGRISFLIENEKDDQASHSHLKSRSERRSVATVLLKRSSSTSTSVDVKKGGFWRFGRLFRKKREKDFELPGKNAGGDGEKCEIWSVENRGVSRSKSLCDYRGSLDNSGRPSDLSKDGHADPDRRSGKIEGPCPSLKPGGDFKGLRKGGLFDFDGSFCGGENSGFIDLKLGSFSESKPEFASVKGADFSESESGSRVSRDGDLSRLESQSFEYLRGNGVFSDGSSCRITVNSNEVKKSKKSFKVWKWIVKHHSSSPVWPAWKKNEHQEFKF